MEIIENRRKLSGKEELRRGTYFWKRWHENFEVFRGERKITKLPKD